MLFLVGRNLAKVIFERRRGLIGSKFQVRLVAGFIAVALMPSAFLLYVSGVFLHADIDSWFNPEYEQVLNDSLEIAKTYYLNSANNASHFARVLAEEISAQGLLAPEKRDDLKAFIDKRQQEYNLGTIEVFSADRKLLLLDISPKTPTGIGASPDSPIISQTLKGQALTRTDRSAAPTWFAAPRRFTSRAKPTTCSARWWSITICRRASRRAPPTSRASPRITSSCEFCASRS